MIKLKFTVKYFLIISIVIFSACNNLSKKEGKNVSKNIDAETSDAIVFGSNSALKNIVFFGNYECTFCRKFFKEDLSKLVSNGDIKITFFIIPQTKSQAEINASTMAVSVYKFGNYDAFHNLLLKEENIINTYNFTDYINQIMEFNNAIADYYLSGNAIDVINNNIDVFKSLELKGTPAFIIDNKLYSGYLSYDEIRSIMGAM